MVSGAKSGANFSLKACCNLVKRVEVVIFLPRLFFLLISQKFSVILLYIKQRPMNRKDIANRLSKKLNEWNLDETLSYCKEETSTRDFLINRFFEEILGYDKMYDFLPEYKADMGNNKRKRVDMAINFGKQHPSILVECKKSTQNLTNDNLRQLYEYCRDISTVSIGILTNGIIYKFFSKDAVKENYHKPFFTFNLSDYSQSDLEFLSLFYRNNIEIKLIEQEAEEIYFRDKFEDSLFNVLSYKSDALATLIFRDMFPNTTLRPKVVKRIQESINSVTLNNAIDKLIDVEIHKSNTGIITTDEEHNFFNIVTTILSMSSQKMDKEIHRVKAKDSPNRFSILADNKKLCSLITKKSKIDVEIQGNKFTINNVSVAEITKLKKELIQSAKDILFN